MAGRQFLPGPLLSPENDKNSVLSTVVRPVLSVRSGVCAVFLPLSAIFNAQPLLCQLPHFRLGFLDDDSSLDVHPSLILLDAIRDRIGSAGHLGSTIPPLPGAVLVWLQSKSSVRFLPRTAMPL